jgi:hypothetical protein
MSALHRSRDVQGGFLRHGDLLDCMCVMKRMRTADMRADEINTASNSCAAEDVPLKLGYGNRASV